MTDSPAHWRKISSRRIADCRVFKVREDLAESEGRERRFFVIENPAWVNVVALTPQREVILIEQYRHGLDGMTVEIPGGMVDPDEDPAETAKRELLEETGYSCSKVVSIGASTPNPAIQDNVQYHFLATGCVRTGEPDFDDDESIRTFLVPLEDIPEAISSGRITHSLVIAAFHYFNLHESQGK